MFILTPSNRLVFKAHVTFPELRGISKLRGSICDEATALAATAGIQLTFVKRGFSEIEGCPSFLENWPPLKVTSYFGAQNTLKMTLTFHKPSSHIQNLHFAKKNGSKTTNPALSSGLKKALPHIWGYHHQLDDLHKEPSNDRYKGHPDGQLTNQKLHWSSILLDKDSHKDKIWWII